ncbi:MAG: hypothetical protein QOJ54_2541 [Aliidongia sp.]|jgi:probable addiction module antidote protein|nr:hypothetical protein [Aliidongia sp.]
MGKTETILWDPAVHLKTDADVEAYLDAVLEDGDPALLAAVLGDIARAKGMTEVAHAAGLTRASLYKALSPDANPKLGTIMKVLGALGIKLQVRPHAA